MGTDSRLGKLTMGDLSVIFPAVAKHWGAVFEGAPMATWIATLEAELDSGRLVGIGRDDFQELAAKFVAFLDDCPDDSRTAVVDGVIEGCLESQKCLMGSNDSEASARVVDWACKFLWRYERCVTDGTRAALGDACFNFDMTEEAIRLLEPVIGTHADKPVEQEILLSHVATLVAALRDVGRVEDAICHLHRAVESVDDVRVLSEVAFNGAHSCGLMALELGEPGLGRQLLVNVLSRYERRDSSRSNGMLVKLCYELCHAERQCGHLDSAMRYAERAATLASDARECTASDRVETLIALACVHYARNDVLLAAQVATSALEAAGKCLSPEHPLAAKAHVWLGRADAALGNDDEAECHLRAAVRISHDAQGEYAQAEGACQQALAEFLQSRNRSEN